MNVSLQGLSPTAERCKEWGIENSPDVIVKTCAFKGGQNWILRPVNKIVLDENNKLLFIRPKTDNSFSTCQSWDPASAKTVQNQIRDESRIMFPMTSHTLRDTETHDTQM